uniref:Uncharacterized protein n=1 Tax=Arundo donax TaxID=35708 RepID=A0A0A9ASU4_ARUDO
MMVEPEIHGCITRTIRKFVLLKHAKLVTHEREKLE